MVLKFCDLCRTDHKTQHRSQNFNTTNKKPIQPLKPPQSTDNCNKTLATQTTSETIIVSEVVKVLLQLSVDCGGFRGCIGFLRLSVGCGGFYRSFFEVACLWIVEVLGVV